MGSAVLILSGALNYRSACDFLFLLVL